MSFIIAKSEFLNFIDERLRESAQELPHAMGPKDVAKQLCVYISDYSGRRVRVRMQSGRIQLHQAFDIAEPANSLPAFQSPKPGTTFRPCSVSKIFECWMV